MLIKIKKLSEDAQIPKVSTKDSVGADIVSNKVTASEKYLEYGTGLAIQIPKGYVGLLFPRSSISETKLSMANAVGVLDPDYLGEVRFRFRYDGKYDKDCYKPGERVGQLVVVKTEQLEFEEVKSLEDTERGSGGFGSTGK